MIAMALGDIDLGDFSGLPGTNMEVKQISNDMDQKCFRVHASEVNDYNSLYICLPHPNGKIRAKFIILGPNEAQGYPSGVNIPRPSFRGSDKEWLKKIGISKKN